MREFQFLWNYYINFRINDLEKRKNTLVPPCYGFNYTTTILYKDGFGIK